ncbi:MAG TPA: tryptophan synthase subunit alpha, partial [Streptosporangiaceae bacterium]
MSAAHIAGQAGLGGSGGSSPAGSGRGGAPEAYPRRAGQLGGSGGSSPRASRVSAAFEEAAAGGRAALVGYLPAGFPSVAGAAEAAVAIAEAGADVIEIGLPYSDPLMDGPVIQEATYRALAGGTHVTDVLRTVETVAAAGVPTLVMTYWNPVDHYGVAAFARDLAAAGGSG